MYKKIILNILTAFVLLTNHSLLSQEPKNDAVFQSINKTYTLNRDGSFQYAYSHKVKLLTFRAVSNYLGETSIFYNPKFQELTINKSQTTMADGTIISTPENGYNEVLPRFVHRAPGYAHLREMVVSHTGLERNSIVELEYHITTKKEFLPWLMGEELFGRRSPVESETVTVRVPENSDLKYRLMNYVLTPKIDKKDGFTIFQWKINDLDPLKNEENHQNFAEITPRLLFSTCPDWKTLADYMKKLLESKYKLSNKSKSTLLNNIKSLDQGTRILSIQKSIASNIGNQSMDFSLTGFRCVSAEETFQRNYGTILDKAVLLKHLLENEDINSDIALVSGCSQFCKKVPALSQFNEACVISSTETDEFFMLYPDRIQKRKGQIEMADKTLLDLGDEDRLLMKIQDNSAMKNYVKIKGNLTVDPQLDFCGNIILEICGTFYPAYNIQTENNKAKFLSKILNSLLPNTVVKDFSVLNLDNDKAVFSINFSSSKPFKKIANTSLYESFSLNSIFDNWHISSSYFSRTTPLKLPAPLTEHILLSIKIPEKTSLAVKPENYDYSCKNGHLMFQIKQQKNNIIIERQLSITDDTITPSDYPEFRKILIALSAEKHRSFVIKSEIN